MSELSWIEELRAAFAVDFLTTEPEDLVHYGRDWTRVYEPAPSAVVFPRTTEEVADCMRFCAQKGVPVVPSGGRTGLAGGAVAAGGELVMSFDRMNRMDPVDLLSLTVRVQAGAITEAVHRHCEELGVTWPIDLSAKGSSQIGGNIATNAGGSRVIRYGMTRNWVSGLQVVTADGKVLELNGSLQKNNTGLDLCQLFIGTEGTFGIITEATLKLTPLPKNVETLFLAVDGIGCAIELLKHSRLTAPFPILSFEYLTRGCLETVLRTGLHHSPIADPAQSYVLIELDCPEQGAGETLQTWLGTVMEHELIVDGVMAQSVKQKRELWALRESISESLAARGMLHKNDIALPVANLQAFVRELHDTLQEGYSELEVFLFGHLGDGNLHVNILKPDDMEKARFLDLTRGTDVKVFELVQRHSGSVSAEHGIGLLKKKALAYTRTPEELRLFAELKQVLDPRGLLNPGKIVG